MTFQLAENIDGLLLLIARGATLDQAAAEVGVSGKTLERRLPREYPLAYQAALAGRPYLRGRHGTRSRYGTGCRCVECTDAQRVTQRALAKREPKKHGASAYTNYHCRCQVCKAAGATRNAKTYGKIKSGEWKASHGTSAKMSTGCRCKECSYILEGQLEKRRDIEAVSVAGAHHHRQEWTGPELEVVARQDLTRREMAKLLGRTVNAVTKQRSLMFGKQADPRKQAFL